KPEGGDCGVSGRCHRGRASDWRPGWSRRAAAGGVVLRTDHPDLGSAACRGVVGRLPGRGRRRRRAAGDPADGRRAMIVLALLVSVGLCVATLALLNDSAIAGHAPAWFWAMVVAGWIAASYAVARLSALKLTRPAQRLVDVAVPVLFGAFVFYLWEVAVRGFGVPPVLLPAPSAIATRFVSSLPTLGADFVQTFLRGVLSGYAIGCA